MTQQASLSRSELLRFLTEACELEHGLACSYLYAAMSLRLEPDGRKLTADQLPMLRQWASQIYFVASQEMLHLAQAWNLLTALGGTPYYLRPNFPQSSKYYPIHMRLALEPFGEAALARFIGYEKPLNVSAEHLHVEAFVKPRKEDPADFRTIGELYEIIKHAVTELPNAIVGEPSAQVGPELIDFPDIIKVVDVDSARGAIDMVTHQGEGNETDREDCHFGIFLKLQDAFRKETKENPHFSPAYPALVNPATDVSGEYGAPEATWIEVPLARDAAKLFDGLYSLMLRMLGYTFTPCGQPELRRALGQSAIMMMATVLKPLGEALMHLPATSEARGPVAGPPFGLTRHVTLPVDPNAAGVLVSERLAGLIVKAGNLASSPLAPPALGRIESTLRRLGSLSEIVSAKRAQGSPA